MVLQTLRIHKANPVEKPLFLIIWAYKGILPQTLITGMGEVSKV